MGEGRVSTVNEKVSVKDKSNLFSVAVFELSDSDFKETTCSEREKCSQTSERISTRKLISAVGHAWNLAKGPLSVLQSETKPACKKECDHGDGVLYYSPGGETFQVPASAGTKSQSTYSNSIKHSDGKVIINKAFVLPPDCERLPSWRAILRRPSISNGLYTISSQFVCDGVPTKLRNIYLWMSDVALFEKKTRVNLVQVEKEKVNYCGKFRLSESIFRLNGTTSISSYKTGSSRPADLISCKSDDSVILSSCSDENHQYTNLAPTNNGWPYDTEKSSENLDANQKGSMPASTEAASSEIEFTLRKDAPQYTIARHEHAFVGAMSGVFVSLCLHPIDTVKTVIQSRRADMKPFHSMVRTIITEKGVCGLYRGISSKMLCSAPISAIYIFTYESVKRSTIPLLPKEYCSLAHCTAGAFASIATSFIFTPSEHIKQQMQVGSHYKNCWNALIQILKEGGVPSLYTGWGAVLCRNIPHSVIKFYTYENLKRTILPSFESDPRANTVATLVCGGLAGSSAALFTTPFDVVKTRLQTQIPGSMTTQYSGVYSTLTKIWRQDGLRGLYRGLSPRLVMYMIQGALFFTSYETLKRLFSLELQHKDEEENEDK